MSPVRRLLERLESGENVDYSALQKVTYQDVEKALERTAASSNKTLDLYDKWTKEFGSV
jgi:hypothetical protein